MGKPILFFTVIIFFGYIFFFHEYIDSVVDTKLSGMILEKFQRLADLGSGQKVSEVFGKDTRKVCIQTPYLPAEFFFAETGIEDSYNYEEIMDDEYRFWVVSSKGQVKIATVSRGLVDKEKSSQDRCVSAVGNLKVSKREDGWLYFRWSEK